ncbi:MAG: PrsW family glutamic-type intramembrane protease [Candidatus Cloacimonetes bacterium]|nr:PrsW family glutamic-type intramembrane protease [Candidatus Cloacimonadota bacterium]
MTLLVSAITPVIILLYLFFRKDANKEPASILVKCFLGGILSIMITLIIVRPFTLLSFSNPFFQSFYTAFFLAAIPEEFSKWIIFCWLAWKSLHYDEHYDGILYAVFISLGFAMLENILYVMNGGFYTAMMRSVLAVPAHAFFAVSMGYFFSLSKFCVNQKYRRHLYLSLLVPIILHGIYDFLLIYTAKAIYFSITLSGILSLLFIVFVIKLWQLGLQRIKQHIDRDKKREEREKEMIEIEVRAEVEAEVEVNLETEVETND